MGKRIPVKRKKDKRIFTHAADKTKKINIAPNVARGGIRL